MGSSVVFSFLLIALCCHGYGAYPAVESTTEGKNTTPKDKLEAKAGGISVRFGAYETSDDDQLMFPGISNRAFGSFGSSSSSSPSSGSSSSSSASSSASSKRVSGESGHQVSAVHAGRPAEIQQVPKSAPSPCRSCCTSNPCGGVPSLPPSGGAYFPDQSVYVPPPPPQYGGNGEYFPGFGGNPYPGFVHGGSGSYSSSQASSSSGYNKYGNGYNHGGNQIVPEYPIGGTFGHNHGAGGNGYYPGSSASSSANSYAGVNNAGYSGHPAYPAGVPGFGHGGLPGGFSGSGSYSSSSSSSSATKGGSFSSSSSQSGSVSGGGRPVRPVVPPAPVPGGSPEFNLPDGSCRSSAC